MLIRNMKLSNLGVQNYDHEPSAASRSIQLDREMKVDQ
jgi:hypothetical protein